MSLKFIKKLFKLNIFKKLFHWPVFEWLTNNSINSYVFVIVNYNSMSHLNALFKYKFAF